MSFIDGGVVRHRHISLSQIAQLLPELKLSSCGARRENLSQISPRILRCACIPNVAQKLVAHTRCGAIENFARRMFLGREVSLCRFGCCVIRSIDITLVAMPEQVLVHLVRPRCVVSFVELLSRKRASHSFVYSFLLQFFTRD